MGDVTELRCWPACIGAIDWSEDGILALASDEHVEVVFPGTSTFDADSDHPRWEHVPLAVPLFTYEELPNKEIASLDVFSIGEEISSSAPIAIAWSSAGLARYRKCALAVLTANLVLSIWSADDVHQETSWGRKLIVNHGLERHFDSNMADVSVPLTPEAVATRRLRSRVRAFAWAPPVPSSQTQGAIGTPMAYAQHIVAITNDDNQVVLIAIKSPTSTLGVESNWSAEVIKDFQMAPDIGPPQPYAAIFDDIMNEQKFISHISWSPWTVLGDHIHSVIAYASNKDVRARSVKISQDGIDLGPEIKYTDIELKYRGPLTWAPTIEDGHKMHFALFGSKLVYLVVSCHDASVISSSTHNLDGRWDKVSGVCWDTASPYTRRLHFSSLLSTLDCPTAVFDLVGGELRPCTSPKWKGKIYENLAQFNKKNNTKGYGKAKVWGLTVSPLGTFVAACNTAHPSDMIEYGIPADRHATIAISPLIPYDGVRKALPSQNVSAESLLFLLNKVVENTVDDETDLPAFAEEMERQLMNTFPPPQKRSNIGDSSSSSEADDLKFLVDLLRIEAVFNEHVLPDRYKLLLNQVCNHLDPVEVPKTMIAYRLAEAVLKLPLSLSQTPFSSEILAQLQHLVLLIDAVVKAAGPDPSNQSVPIVPDGDKLSSSYKYYLDTCTFCSTDIPFNDLNTAVCKNGHQFPRCGLSFIAIQAPGITKYCGICKTPFLSNEFVAAQERDMQAKTTVAKEVATGGGMEEDSQAQGQQESSDVANEAAELSGAVEEQKMSTLPLTLARVLFQACDMCIYCGGKFGG